MILWQKRTLVPAADVGVPGPLPAHITGLSAVSLANLEVALNPAAVAALGLANTGYVAVISADVPGTVTRLQFTTALQDAGAYGSVATAVNSLPNTDPIKVYFLNASTFQRQDPRLLAFAAWQSYSPAQVDSVFIAAAAVPQ